MAEGELKLVEVMTKAKVYVQTAALFRDPQDNINQLSQMGRSRGEASRRPMDIFHERN